MVYEIKRKSGENQVDVHFKGDVPVEVREALLENGFTWNDWRKCWSSLDIHEDCAIRAMIKSACDCVKERPVMTKAEEKALRDEYMALVMAGENETWRKYYEGKIGTIVKLTDGRLVEIEKPRIETRFCFGESGYDAEEAARKAEIAITREDYFLSANLKALREEIAFLSRKPSAQTFQGRAIVTDTRKAGIASYSTDRLWYHRDEVHEEISEEDRERLLEGYKRVYVAFEKRLKTYLKRYGLSKVQSWTYWRDA